MSEEVIAAYGAGQGSLLQPVLERVAEYLVPHSYTLVGTTTRVPLHGKTSKALHTEIMAIGAPFDLVLTDLDEEEISDDFLEKCKHLVSISIHAPKVTKIGSLFLGDCTSLSCFDTSGLTSVTTIGEGFERFRIRWVEGGGRGGVGVNAVRRASGRTMVQQAQSLPLREAGRGGLCLSKTKAPHPAFHSQPIIYLNNQGNARRCPETPIVRPCSMAKFSRKELAYTFPRIRPERRRE